MNDQEKQKEFILVAIDWSKAIPKNVEQHRFNGENGYERALCAMGLFQKQRPERSYTILGSDPEFLELRGKAKPESTTHKITAHKGKPHEKVIDVTLPNAMSGEEYRQRAMRTLCPQGEVVLQRLAKSPDFWTTLLHSVIGMMGELGEICTAIQGAVWYNKGGIDVTNLQEEFGDIGWYHAEGVTALLRNMDDTQTKNLLKLIARYPEKFSEFLAAEENRDREGERKVLEGIEEKMIPSTCVGLSPAEVASRRKELGFKDDPEDAYVVTVDPDPQYGEPCPLCEVERVFNELKAEYETASKKDNYTNGEHAMKLTGAMELARKLGGFAK